MGLVVRNLTLQRVGDAAMATIRIVGMAFMLLGGAVIFGHFLAVSRIPFNLATSISMLQVPPVVVLMAILLVYMIAGCFIEGMAFFILTIPIFFPVVVALGYDPVWFGVIQGVVGLMGTITPPVGINVYIVNSVIKDVPMDVVFRGATPFLPAYLICSAILILFPQIATFLPNL